MHPIEIARTRGKQQSGKHCRVSRVNDYRDIRMALLSQCRAFVARTWPPRAGKITLRPWRSRESMMGCKIPSRGLHHRGNSPRSFQGGLRVIFRNPARRAPDTFRPERATSRRAPWLRALLATRGEPASEPCRAAKSDKLPNARQRPTPSAAAKSENGARRLQRQNIDVRALAQLGRHGEAAGLDASGRQREPATARRTRRRDCWLTLIQTRQSTSVFVNDTPAIHPCGAPTSGSEPTAGLRASLTP
jgi:hypothetical protein